MCKMFNPEMFTLVTHLGASVIWSKEVRINACNWVGKWEWAIVSVQISEQIGRAIGSHLQGIHEGIGISEMAE